MASLTTFDRADDRALSIIPGLDRCTACGDTSGQLRLKVEGQPWAALCGRCIAIARRGWPTDYRRCVGCGWLTTGVAVGDFGICDSCRATLRAYLWPGAQKSRRPLASWADGEHPNRRQRKTLDGGMVTDSASPVKAKTENLGAWVRVPRASSWTLLQSLWLRLWDRRAVL